MTPVALRTMLQADIPQAIAIVAAHSATDGRLAERYFRVYFRDADRVRSSREQSVDSTPACQPAVRLSLATAAAGRKSVFAVTPYVADASGQRRVQLPDRYVRAQPGQRCTLRIDHHRVRKTGPGLPLAVVGPGHHNALRRKRLQRRPAEPSARRWSPSRHALRVNALPLRPVLTTLTQIGVLTLP